MSQESDTGALESAYRTVSPAYRPHGQPEMSLVGWVIFLGAMTLLFPLVPFFLVLLAVSKLIKRLNRR